ncbi:FAD/NAD(P)-binding protein [Catenulispora pinisilvae]|uniref:FAD/NAD(P)-binding protein n=1 Tax=Catenulispora pinisilvae TaxID=2705253 RepID=UPI0018913DB2|nr:FAD/NAD(P)-binding protein [Catenulispora pinisilvae]
MDRECSSSIAIVGAGTRGVSLVERIGANVSELLPGQHLGLYLIDPYPAGPGRVWRYDQPSMLQANSIAGMLTMFTDDSVVCEGPILPGPSFTEWAEAVRSGTYAIPDDPELAAELGDLGEWSYASRRLVSAYLTWAFAEIQERLPPSVTLHVIQDEAVDVADLPTGQQSVTLANHDDVVVDAVVLAVGHLDAGPTRREAALKAFAAGRDLVYIPPAYSADVDLHDIEPGDTVIIRGMGLAFVDFTAMLTEGRGGMFRDCGDGTLNYIPSGNEPVIVAGSRRGVPHHGKPNYRLTSPPPELPRFLTAEQLATRASLDYDRDIAPLVVKEIAWAYYHEYLHQQGTQPAAFEGFVARFASASWESPEMRALIAEFVPDPRDRFDFDAVARPLSDQRFEPEQLQDRVREYIRDDLSRRLDQRYAADLRVAYGVESVLEQLTTDAVLSRLDPQDVQARVDAQLISLAKKTGSGPPAARLRQLIALSEAGIVRFLGAGIWAEADEASGLFRAGSASSPETFTARALIEARLPDATVSRSADELIRSLHHRGELAEQVLTGSGGRSYARGQLVVNVADGRAISAAGTTHPRRYALGSYTTSGAQSAFIFPGRNSLVLRQNDVAARQLLTGLANQGSTADGEQAVMVSS